MKKPEDQIGIVNKDGEGISDQLGITPERRKEVQKTVDGFIKEELEKGEDASRANVLCRVWNEFEDKYECAFALFILNHEETGVQIHEMFRLPESVEA